MSWYGRVGFYVTGVVAAYDSLGSRVSGIQ
jgi:hypothetical protein